MSFVKKNGKLKVFNNKLVNEKLEPIQLRGISSFGLGKEKNIISINTIEFLIRYININCFRIALSVDGDDGYIFNKNLIKRVEELIDICIELDIYCIIDWHIYFEGNPLKYEQESKNFFDKISKKYNSNNNILYEICNEPHDEDNWDYIIKPYATEIINTIRKNDKDNIIIVGTPSWSNDIDKIDKLNFENIIYTFHFYPTGNDEIDNFNINRINIAIKNEIPIFVTEFGFGDAFGKKLYKDTGEKFLKVLNKYNISYICWALSNNDNTLGLLTPNTVGYENLNLDNISLSGELLKENYKK